MNPKERLELENQAAWTRLLYLMRTAVLRGKVTLTSGQESDWYLDVKRIALHPDGPFLLGAALYAAGLDHFAFVPARGKDPSPRWTFQAIAGPELGAVPLVTALQVYAALQGVYIPGLVVRKGDRDHGTESRVEGLCNVLPGDRVLVIEDVVTTGGTTAKAIEALKASGLKPIGLMAVLIRDEDVPSKLMKEHDLEAVATVFDVGDLL